MKQTANIIPLQPERFLFKDTPELIRIAFEIFYSQYLDQPDKEMLFYTAEKIKSKMPLQERFSLLVPLVSQFVIDCFTAGSSLLMDARLLPHQHQVAEHYLNAQQNSTKVQFSLYMRYISAKLSGEEKKEAVRTAVQDFLYHISRQAYYKAAKDMYRKISA